MKTIHGNILTVEHGHILQQVNAQGVMGSGVAAGIRARYPKVWDEYSLYVKPGSADSGRSHLGMVISVPVSETLAIHNIVGQQFYGRHADGQQPRYTSYDALDTGLQALAWQLGKLGEAQEVHFPLIGCGLGGGKWEVVSEIIKHRLHAHELTLWTWA